MKLHLCNNIYFTMSGHLLSSSGMMAHGLDHLVDQVVHQKTSRSFLPKIKEVVYDFLGLPNPQPRLPLLGLLLFTLSHCYRIEF